MTSVGDASPFRASAPFRVATKNAPNHDDLSGFAGATAPAWTPTAVLDRHEAPAFGEPSLAERQAAHADFRARLRAAEDSDALKAAIGRVRDPQAAYDAMVDRQRARDGLPPLPKAQGSEHVPSHDGGSPRNRKNSVAAGTSETACDLGEDSGENGAARDLGLKYEQRNNRTQQKMRMLDEARQVTLLHSLKRCGVQAIAGAVSVGMNEAGAGTFAGVFRCGSVWSCPECSPIVRADRAANLETWAAAWMKAKHGLAMATLTARHGKHGRLGPQIERTTAAWRRMLQSRWWRKFCATYGIVGAVRAIEMTHSWTNSWHVHIHAVLWTENPVDTDLAREMEGELYARWRDEMKHAKLGQPSRKHGVKVDPCRTELDAKKVAKYLVKVQDKDDKKGSARALGNEVLRGDLKEGRRDGRTPFEILRRALVETTDDRGLYAKAATRARRRKDDLVAQAAADDLLATVHANAWMELWLEYEAATKGHRMLTWTGPIKDRLREEGCTVEETAAADLVDETAKTKAILVQVQPKAFKHVIGWVPGRRGQLRQAIQTTADFAKEVGLDGDAREAKARAVVCAILESWGLSDGADFTSGPGINTETGVITEADLPTPPQPKPVRRPHRWLTNDQLRAEHQLLGITPRDYARPERAHRRAQGLPVRQCFLY